MEFKSDNTSGVNIEILNAISRANQGFQKSYGADEYSLILQKKLSEIFEKDVIIYLTSTGTAANSLALSSLVRPYNLIFCSNEAHIYTDECGAPELYTNGAKLMTVKSENGKIDTSDLVDKILILSSRAPHGQKPGCISITQATEYGTVYDRHELNKIALIGKAHDLPIHMDGARFVNSLISLNCKPADITWKVGVDVMSFGATKNGAMCGEVIIFFNHQYAENFAYLHKRSGQLLSKSRFFASQLIGYLENDLWLRNAKNSNDMAQNLLSVFNKFDIQAIYPVQANELFMKLESNCANYLWKQNCQFYQWGAETSNIYRFVTSWSTTTEEITQLENCLTRYSK
jgi:threonine aldolase